MLFEDSRETLLKAEVIYLIGCGCTERDVEGIFLLFAPTLYTIEVLFLSIRI